MIVVSYQFQFEYAHDPDGNRFPRLNFRVSNPRSSAEAVDVRAYLDSGTERSLLNGWIGAALGIDILYLARRRNFETITRYRKPASLPIQAPTIRG